MSRFLITGLPRSRTAWWAVVTGARHEPISRDGLDHFKWEPHMGVSDAGAGLYLPGIILAYQPRILIIERPFDEVVRSLENYVKGRASLDWGRVASELHRLESALKLDHDSILRVKYDQLNDLAVVRECLNWLRLNAPPNLEELMHMRVESDLGWNIAQLQERAA